MRKIFVLSAGVLLAGFAGAVPSNCGGNACHMLDITNIQYHQGGTAIASVDISNVGDKAINYEVHWVSFVGQCNVKHKNSLAPGQTSKINHSLAMYPGWCKVVANVR